MIRTKFLIFSLTLISALGISSTETSLPLLENPACTAATAEIENFMSQNQSCSSDSDCNTECGGCIVLVFNNSTDRTELARLKSIYDDACRGQGLCGIPPGKPKCKNSICIASYQ